MTIGDRIKELRKEKGFTQAGLAAQIGIEHSTIGRWEKNENEPKLTDAVKLANVLDTTCEDFVGVIKGVDGVAFRRRRLVMNTIRAKLDELDLLMNELK